MFILIKSCRAFINMPIISPSKYLGIITKINDNIISGYFSDDVKFADNGTENWQPVHLYEVTKNLDIEPGEYYILSVGIGNTKNFRLSSEPFEKGQKQKSHYYKILASTNPKISTGKYLQYKEIMEALKMVIFNDDGYLLNLAKN